MLVSRHMAATVSTRFMHSPHLDVKNAVDLRVTPRMQMGAPGLGAVTLLQNQREEAGGGGREKRSNSICDWDNCRGWRSPVSIGPAGAIGLNQTGWAGES